MLAQVFLVMIIATALNTRFEGLAKNRPTQRVFQVYYGAIMLAILVNVSVILSGVKEFAAGSVIPWLMLILNVPATIAGFVVLGLYVLLLVRGIKEQSSEAEVETVETTSDAPDRNVHRWSFHVEYRKPERRDRLRA